MSEGHTPREMWGKDHLSLLVYCESRVVDHGGTMDPRHLRGRTATGGTRLRGGRTLLDHGDLDVLMDLEQEGMLINKGSGSTPLVVLTNRGWHLAQALRRFRGEGGKAWEDFGELHTDDCPTCKQAVVKKK